MDQTNESNLLKQYYQNLDPNSVKNDVELMKVANVTELYELIANNCQHYVSIIENYHELNLQTLFNMTIRRVEGHLIIKFKLNSNDRWVEVGFFDDHNTDEETLSELKNMIKFHLKNYDQNNQNRRQHIASQFDNDNLITCCVKETKKALPDNYFDPKDNPELNVTQNQLKSAGYDILPPTHNVSKNKIVTDIDNDINEVVNNEVNSNVNVNVTDQLVELSKFLSLDDQPLLEKLVDQNQDFLQLLKLFKHISVLLQTIPTEYHNSIYQFVTECVAHQNPIVLGQLILYFLHTF